MITGPKFRSLLFPTEVRIGEAFSGLPHRIHWTCCFSGARYLCLALSDGQSRERLLHSCCLSKTHASAHYIPSSNYLAPCHLLVLMQALTARGG